MDRRTLAKKWQDFFSEYEYDSRAISVADAFPEKRSLWVDYKDMDMWDAEFIGYVLEHPEESLSVGEEVLLEALPADSKEIVDRETKFMSKIHIRIKGAPGDRFVDIREIRHEHVGKFLSISGIIKRASVIRPRLLRGVFRCARCRHETILSQDGLRFVEPVICDQEDGGCGKNANQTSFKLLPDRSLYVDTQFLEVQEEMDGIRGGAQPQSLSIWLEDDVVGLLFPGDRARINGILEATQKRKGVEKLTQFDIHLNCVSIAREKTDYETMVPSEEDMEEITRLKNDPDICSNIRNSIAPTIYGYDEVKEALALQLFGGVEKDIERDREGSSRQRGDIHILLIGDPGTAKSQLLKRMSEIAPRGIYASGKGASAAGLTAAAVKDEGTDGRWTLEAGVLVLADKGTACIDEMDKMSNQDRSSMHEAMEQQSVTVAKAGITATLRSRCSVLGAANPKKGRFDEFATPVDQIDMPPTLLSRFDFVFPLSDRPGPQDEGIADHILSVHEAGAAFMQNRKRSLSPEIDPDVMDRGKELVLPPISRDILRKYIAYSKDNCFPVLTPHAKNKIKEFYIGLRKKGERRGSAVPITARQLEAIIRISEASARMRLSDIVDENDADRAVAIMTYFLGKLASEGDTGDIDRIMSPYSHRQRGTALELRHIIVDMIRKEPEGANMEDVLDEAEGRGFDRTEAKTTLEKLARGGEIYEKRRNMFVLSGGM